MKTLIQRLLRRRNEQIFVVIGEQLKPYEEPGYSTHPDSYGYDFDPKKTSPKSPTTFPRSPLTRPFDEEREKGVIVIKVFSKPKDAINFTYACNLASALSFACDRSKNGWDFSADQSAFDINW